MAKVAIRKETIKKNTIEAMKTLGVFKTEYEPLIDIYSELWEQYRRLTEKYFKEGMPYQEVTLQGGAKKSPIVATLESLRKDILAYSDRLCLNPKAIETVTVDRKSTSKLDELFSRRK